MPSKPRRTAVRAAGTVWIPLRTIGPFQASRIGASAAQPCPGCGGESTRWVHPAACARRSSARSGSPPSGQSRPNHREPWGAAAATASTGLLERDEWTYVRSRPAAARAVAISPSGCARAWRPTGPRMTGAGISTPSTFVVRSRLSRSMNIRGTIRHARSARRLARTAAAPPASGEQMPARVLGQHLRRGGLEVGQVRGEDRLDVRGHPGDIDLGLVGAERGGRADRGRRRAERGAGRRTGRGERGRREDGHGGGRNGSLEELATSALGHVFVSIHRARVRDERERPRWLRWPALRTSSSSSSTSLRMTIRVPLCPPSARP